MLKCIIIVTYEPALEHLSSLIKNVQTAGFLPILVDNSEKHPLKKGMFLGEIQMIFMEGNAGIAAAQNAGVLLAKKLGEELIGFFDQDSQADAELIQKLSDYTELYDGCVVAPLALEKDTLLEYPVQRLNKMGYPKDVYVKNAKRPQKVDLVISSGTMMSMKVLEKAGMFDEDFFIDFVDIEWCLRCKKAAIPIYVLPDAVLYHKIGNETIDAGQMKITVHSPLRTYYKVRNSFLLLYKKVNVIFAFRQILPAVIHNFLLIFQEENKKEYLKYYLLGICHGVCGIKGKYKKGNRNAKRKHKHLYGLL